MMASNQVIVQCPIWPEFKVLLTRDKFGEKVVEQSPRAGGNYVITNAAHYDIQDLNEYQRARLTTILVDKRNQGCKWPRVTLQLLELAKNRKPLSNEERAARLLIFMVKKTESLGDKLTINESTLEAYAWSESIKWLEAHYLLKHLCQSNLIEGVLTESKFDGEVTWEGLKSVRGNMNQPSSSARRMGFKTQDGVYK